jgi:hypothetical protein
LHQAPGVARGHERPASLALTSRFGHCSRSLDSAMNFIHYKLPGGQAAARCVRGRCSGAQAINER